MNTQKTKRGRSLVREETSMLSYNNMLILQNIIIYGYPILVYTIYLFLNV